MMRQTPVSLAERKFITRAIKQNLRLDGRKNEEHRRMQIHFGREWGSVMVMLGQTRVVAQVTGELDAPMATRPTEGLLYINVELGPMAAPHFETGRNSDLTLKINRLLERTIKDSRCVDLESLCVVAEERVWVLRINLTALNHMGNLIDCCSIAALCALAHFQRPDVTITKNEVKIHTAAEKELLPMVMHHYPVCISYNTFDDGRIAIADATVEEERCAESLMVFGLNSFRELCCLNLGGRAMVTPQLMLRYAHKAAIRTKYVVDFVKKALERDQQARAAGITNSFVACVRSNLTTGLADDRLSLRLRNFNFQDIFGPEKKEVAPAAEAADKVSGAKLDDNKYNVKWVPDEEEDTNQNVVDMDSNNSMSGDNSDNDINNQLESPNQPAEETKNTRRPTASRLQIRKDQILQKNANETDSEEEEKMVL